MEQTTPERPPYLRIAESEWTDGIYYEEVGTEKEQLKDALVGNDENECIGGIHEHPKPGTGS